MTPGMILICAKTTTQFVAHSSASPRFPIFSKFSLQKITQLVIRKDLIYYWKGLYSWNKIESRIKGSDNLFPRVCFRPRSRQPPTKKTTTRSRHHRVILDEQKKNRILDL